MAAKRKRVKDAKNPGYREQFGVVILCADEAAQRRTYESLLRRGYKAGNLRVVTT